MNDRPRIYLDNAATTWPKPETVYAAVDGYQRNLGAPAGRGGYPQAAMVERLITQARRRTAELAGAGTGYHTALVQNGTAALNLLLQGFLRSGDHVITSVVEHNSVLRPLHALEQHGGVAVTRIACDSQGVVDPDDFRKAICPKTRLIALLHASNVTGALQPCEEVGQIARSHDIALMVDAAQSLGHVPVDAVAMNASLLAAPGHKGLLGPLGSGVACIASNLVAEIPAMILGGTGTQSDLDQHPQSLPDKYEAGNLNCPALVGLAAGAAFVQETTVAAIRQHEKQLTAALLEQLQGVSGVRVLGPADANKQLGVVSVTIENFDSREVAGILDASYGVQTRAGMHCAPLLHQSLGTVASGGAVRLSIGWFNTLDHINVAAAAIADIAAAAM